MKGKFFIMAAGVAIISAALLLLFLFKFQTGDGSSQLLTENDTTAVNLGITYLNITPGLAEYYGLAIDSGALVTEVTPGSQLDRAGVKVGDAILSFNGAGLEKGTSLLGMMRMCSPGKTIVMDVWRAGDTRRIEFMHANGSIREYR